MFLRIESFMSAMFCEIEEEESTSLEWLVLAAQGGDRDAFGELAARFEPMVYGIALRRLGDHSEAQELCQEVLMQAMQKIEQLKAPAAFGGWLRSITVRTAINRQVRRAPTIATEAPGSIANVTPSRIVNGASPLCTVLVRRSARSSGAAFGVISRRWGRPRVPARARRRNAARAAPPTILRDAARRPASRFFYNGPR